MVSGQPSHLLQQIRRFAARDESATDAQLLERFVVQHDEAAFEGLLLRHGPMILGVCRRLLRDVHEAEDAFQATFLVLAKKADAIARREAVASWLYRVAYRIALRVRARPERRPSAPVAEEDVPREETVPPCDWRDLRPVLDDEVNRLPEKLRAPVVLCYLEEKTCEQAARELAWPVGTVKGRLSQARDLLRKRLARRGLALSAAALAAAIPAGEASAIVPPPLHEATNKAAALTAAGHPIPPGLASARALTHAEGIVRAMFLTKLKITAAVALILALAGTSGWLWHRASAETSLGGSNPVLFAADQGKERVGGDDDRGKAPRPDPEKPPAEKAVADGPEPKEPEEVKVPAVKPDSRRRVLAATRFQLPHAKPVLGVAYSPDGKLLATASEDRVVRLYDPATGKEVRKLTGHTLPVTAVAFAAGGKVLASAGSDGTVRLWDPATGKELRKLEGHDGEVTSVGFSADGARLVSGGEDRTVRVWEAGTGKEVKKIEGHTGIVTSVAYQPGGDRVASGSKDKTVRIWNAASGEAVHKLEDHEAPITAVAFSQDGKVLASVDAGGRLLIWGAKEGKLLDNPRHLAVVPEGQGNFSLTFNPDGELYVSTAPMAFSPDRVTQAALTRGGLAILDLTPTRLPSRWSQETVWTGGIAFTADGKKFVTGGGVRATLDAPVVSVWDAATLVPIRHSRGHTDGITGVVFTPDAKRIVSTSHDRTVRIWDAATGEELRKLRGHEEAVTSLSMAPDGKLFATGSKDKTIRIWDVETGKEIRKIDGKKATMFGVVFSPDGKLLASGGTIFDDASGDTLHLWDVATGAEVRKMDGHKGGSSCLAFSPDGKRIASGGRDGSVRMWDVVTGKEVMTPRAPTDRPNYWAMVWSLAFSPDGRLLVAGAEGGSRSLCTIWDLRTGKEVLQIQHGHRQIAALAFTRDGKELAITSYQSPILICNLAEWMAKLPPAGSDKDKE